MNDEYSIPVCYVVSSIIPNEYIAEVLRCFDITPIGCALITDYLHSKLASELSDDVIKVGDQTEALDAARKLFIESGFPSVIIGEAETLDAIYEDGTRKNIC